METPELPVDMPSAAAGIGLPEGLATPVQGGTLSRRTSLKRPPLTGLKFLNELLDDHDLDHDTTNVP
jgi:hypothetical protein